MENTATTSINETVKKMWAIAVDAYPHWKKENYQPCCL